MHLYVSVISWKHFHGCPAHELLPHHPKEGGTLTISSSKAQIGMFLSILSWKQLGQNHCSLWNSHYTNKPTDINCNINIVFFSLKHFTESKN